MGEKIKLTEKEKYDMGSKISELSKEQGFSTYKALANACGVAPSSIYGIENAQRDCSVGVLLKICKVLNCSADYLLGITKANTPDNHDIRNVCDYTGLSQKTVERLNEWKNAEAFVSHVPDMISSLIESEQIASTSFYALEAIDSASREKDHVNESGAVIIGSSDAFDEVERYGFKTIPFGMSAKLYEQLAVNALQEWLRLYIDNNCDNALSEYDPK